MARKIAPEDRKCTRCKKPYVPNQWHHRKKTGTPLPICNSCNAEVCHIKALAKKEVSELERLRGNHMRNAERINAVIARKRGLEMNMNTKD